MPSQRPFFLSTFFASFRQNPPSSLSQQANKHASQASTTTSAASAYAQSSASASASSPRTISSTAGHHHNAAQSSATASAAAAAASSRPSGPGSVVNQLPLHSPRGAGVPIPGSSPGNRRRGSDSSSEGFRDVLGADKWYVGGRTAGGEERFFKLGVVRRVRSNDGLSLDRLSL